VVAAPVALQIQQEQTETMAVVVVRVASGHLGELLEETQPQKLRLFSLVVTPTQLPLEMVAAETLITQQTELHLL
jgi:hypothetical protein